MLAGWGGGGGGEISNVPSPCAGWVSCDGLVSHPAGVVVILLVTLCWVSCDGLASHPGRWRGGGGGEISNVANHYVLAGYPMMD